MVRASTPAQGNSNPSAFWCLGEVGDPKTATLLRKRVLAPLEGEGSTTVTRFVTFCDAVARKCEGGKDTQPEIDAGIEKYREWDGAQALADAARRKRNMQRFVPKGEWGNLPEREGD